MDQEFAPDRPHVDALRAKADRIGCGRGRRCGRGGWCWRCAKAWRRTCRRATAAARQQCPQHCDESQPIEATSTCHTQFPLAGSTSHRVSWSRPLVIMPTTPLRDFSFAYAPEFAEIQRSSHGKRRREFALISFVPGLVNTWHLSGSRSSQLHVRYGVGLRISACGGIEAGAAMPLSAPLIAVTGWTASNLRHPSASWDLERQALHYVALGPSLRRGDGDGRNGVASRRAAWVARPGKAGLLSYSGLTCQRRRHAICETRLPPVHSPCGGVCGVGVFRFWGVSHVSPTGASERGGLAARPRVRGRNRGARRPAPARSPRGGWRGCG